MSHMSLSSFFLGLRGGQLHQVYLFILYIIPIDLLYLICPFPTEICCLANY